MPELNAAATEQTLTEEQKTAMAALMKPVETGQAAAAQGALATKSSRDDTAKSASEGAAKSSNITDSELAAKAERAVKAERDAAAAKPRSVDEIVAVWFAETRLHQPPMVNQHPMDWVQSQLPKLVAALSRR